MKTFREFILIGEESTEEFFRRQGWSEDRINNFMRRQRERISSQGSHFHQNADTNRTSQRSAQSSSTSAGTGKPPGGTPPPGGTGKPPGGTPPPGGTGKPPGGTPPPGGTGKPPGGTPPPGGTGKPPGGTPPPGGTGKPPGGTPASSGRTPTTPKPSFRSRVGKMIGPAAGAVGAGWAAADAYDEYKSRREAGQTKEKAAGGVAANLTGMAAGAAAGSKLVSPIAAAIPNPLAKGAVTGTGTLVGAAIGGPTVSKAYDWAANKTRPARQAISKATGYDRFAKERELAKSLTVPGAAKSSPGSTPMTPGKASNLAKGTIASRSAREIASKKGGFGAVKGSALTGIGGPTSINRQTGKITSGGRTASLASTQLIRDPKSGKNVVGDLAYRGGKAVYLARPSIQSRDTSITAKIGRALNLGRYSKQAEKETARKEYKTALRNTQSYQRQLGISSKQAATQRLPGTGVGSKLVGAKKVGPKIVGAKKVGPTKPTSPVSPLIRPV